MRKNRLFTALLTALVLSVLAYFAADIPFFTWREPLERASLRSVNDGEPLSFSYSGDALTLHGAGENVTVYGLTLGGIAEIPGGSASSFPEDSLGTMAAVRQALDDMRRACGGGDIPAKLVRSTARLLKLTPVEFAQAAARLNRPFATSHVR